MKNIFLAFGLCITFFGNSQNFSKNTLGLRLGDNDGFGTEISYQRALNDDNRLEVNLGWRNNKNQSAVKLSGVYQWVWDIDNGFNWYAGVGGGIGSWSYVNTKSTVIFAAGNIGIEYNFDFPLQLSLDLRPELYFSNQIKSDFGPDFGLGIRYKFD
jgi:hypothetical protein